MAETLNLGGMSEDQIEQLLGQKFTALIEGRLTPEEWRPWGDLSARRDTQRDMAAFKAEQQEMANESRYELFKRYQAEREGAHQARSAAVQEVHDRFAEYQTQMRGFFNLRHEQERLGAKLGALHRTERRDGQELLKAERRGSRVEIQQLRAQQLAAARGAHPVLTWESFVEREAQRGNEAAQKELAHRRDRERSNSLER